MHFNENILNHVSKCVNRDKTISSSDTVFDFGVKFNIFGFCNFLRFSLTTFISETASLRYVSDKVPSAKWPHKPQDNIMFLSKSGLDHWIRYWNLDFHPPPLLCFLCLINSFYRRYISSMYNRSNRSNRSDSFNRLNLAEGQQLKNSFLSPK